MALKPCKECGNEVSTKAQKCPSCGAPIKKKINLGCIGSIIIIIVALILMGKIVNFFEEGSKDKKRLERQRIAAQWEKEKQVSFLNNIEQHYQMLLTAYKNDNLKQASNKLGLFKRYKELNYKDVATINKKVRIATLEHKVRKIPAARAKEDLKIYKQLLALDPQNPRYEKKVAHYTQKAKEIAEAEARKKRKKITEHKRRIATLERKVRKIPAARAKENLKIYKQLLALDPQNPRYEKKVAHYTQKAKEIAEAEARKKR